MKNFKVIFIVILIVIIGFLFVKLATIGYNNKEVIAIEVKDKYIKRQGTGDSAEDVYMIVDKDNNIYQITDLFFIGKFNSSDIYNQLDIGQAYLVEVTGVRNRFFSWYRNINKIL